MNKTETFTKAGQLYYSWVSGMLPFNIVSKPPKKQRFKSYQKPFKGPARLRGNNLALLNQQKAKENEVG